MRHVIQTGTDVAAVAMGDLSLLGELRACEGVDYYPAARDTAIANGALWRADTGADGAYLFHLFIDEEPPEEIQSFLRDPIRVARFRVPSGRLLVAGEECFAGPSRGAPHVEIGSEVLIESGEYALTAYWVEAPDDHLDRRFAEAASPEEQQAWQIGSGAPGWCIIGTLLALLGSCVAYVGTSSLAYAVLPLVPAAAGWLWCRWLLRRPVYKAAEEKFRATELALPALAVVMHRISTAV